MDNLHMIKKPMMMVLTIVIMLALVAPVMAKEGRAAQGRIVPTASSPGQGLTDPTELETFLDELLGREMEENHIAGAAISVVKDGKLFFAKGYGYADLQNKISVEPERSIFSVGSVGKVFTWTAVMQLVEQGKLDLNTDINTYLDFHIPDTYPQPITLKHLMTHTSGFEDRLFGGAVTDAKDLVSERDYLIAHMSARVRPPGEAVAYANYNAMLAGYIVSRVSGQPYDQYIQEHIFDPLGMAHSSARYPVPEGMRSEASVGYTFVKDVFQAFPDYLVQPAGFPSGAHQVTVTDMARFMIAHLEGGVYGDSEISGARILEDATARQMQTTLYTPDPRLRGTAYGFFDFTDNGQKSLGHVGYLPPMHSLLLLLPNQNLGVYVTYNSDGAGDLVNQHLGFQRAFFDHYYPAPAVEPIQTPADTASRAAKFVGSYGFTQGSSTTLEKVGGLLGGVEIKDSGDGALLFDAPWGVWRFAEVEPLYFRSDDGQSGMLFREDDQGRITYMFVDFTPYTAYKKLAWYESPRFHMALVLVSILISLSMLPVATIGAIRERRRRGEANPAPFASQVPQWIIACIGILNVLFLIGTVLWGMPVSILHPVTLMARIVLGLGVISALLTAGALVYAVLAWKNGYWGVAARVYYSLATLAAVAFVWFLNYWNLLGWRF